MGLEEWYFGYLKNAFIPRYLLTLYRVHRVYHISFYSHFVQNKQSFITKKYSLYIVGEVRGAEAIDLLQALNTGHEGSLSTAHANSPEDMVSRLETMVLMGMQLPLEAVRRQIASGTDIFIQLGRDREKKRKVMKITEVTGCEENGVCMQTLFERNDQTGALERSGELCHTAKLEKANLS